MNFDIESKIREHDELLKTHTKIVAGLSEIIQIMRNDQKNLLQSFQKIFSGTLESVRSEFTLALRVVRETLNDKNPIDPATVSPDSLTTIERRIDDLHLVIIREVQDGLGFMVELLTYMQNKIEVLHDAVRELGPK